MYFRMMEDLRYQFQVRKVNQVPAVKMVKEVNLASMGNLDRLVIQVETDVMEDQVIPEGVAKKERGANEVS